MHTDLRIDTLVNASTGSANYIRQILPHGFESFQLTFRQVGDMDLQRLASEVRDVIGDEAVISSLGFFGNPQPAKS